MFAPETDHYSELIPSLPPSSPETVVFAALKRGILDAEVADAARNIKFPNLKIVRRRSSGLESSLYEYFLVRFFDHLDEGENDWWSAFWGPRESLTHWASASDAFLSNGAVVRESWLAANAGKVN